jgi:hypothetical protein
MDYRGKLYLAFFLLMVLVAGVIVVYTWVENKISDAKASKRKVKFKNGKGYWVTKKGDKFDPDLRIDE